ncbi:MAG TPA: phage portal protein [Candidatus Sulfotelmatobacter sp.]|jgi:phage portal protein BeeE|nr:phage portal protein [Candidatus Sulfotelmatobacter sp.]
MARDGGIDIEPGLLTRVAQGLRWVVGGKAPEDWFGPMDPLPPAAPQAAGRQFDYPVGYNLVTQPRQSEPIGFEQLRGLADAYDLMRLAIETRKDQIAKMGWVIRPRIGLNGAPRTAHDDPRIAAAADFFARPDGEHGWDSWLRMLIEDLLVIDAATVYPRRDQAGRLLALEPIDGATIKRVLDERGRTPVPPYPAYQQVLKGLPAVDYRSDELYYLPRNVRSHRVYGYSPVEQVVMTVNIALRRQLHQLQYYTEGNVPEALIGVPETWTPDQIGQFQAYWDALLEGDSAQRRHARFVPATISKSFVQTKDAGLKDDYDEWLARIVCFAFSLSPQALVKEMNRATAETAHDQALQEGLLPLMRWVKDLVDRALRDGFGWSDLEFAWQEASDLDPLTQAKIAQVYLAAGVLSPAEVRAGLGLRGEGGAVSAGPPFREA